jgi:hypothetical protein
MSETLGRLLAAGQRAEVFEWGSRAVKLYRCAAAKQTAFREAAIPCAAAMALATYGSSNASRGSRDKMRTAAAQKNNQGNIRHNC